MLNNAMKFLFSGKTSGYKIISVCALVFMTIFMTAFASRQSFWVDELDWMIGIITGKSVFNYKLFTGMFQILLEQGYNLPLYYLIEIPFYKLLPYGEVFLLIPSIIFVIAGIIILSKAGKLLGGERIGFFTLCISVSSSTLIIQGGWEIRPYSITFCFSALTLLMFIKRLKTETSKNIVWYSIALLLLLYSHWFGSILAIFYGCIDVYLCIKKKVSFKCLLSYIAAGVFFLPWFLLMVFHHVNDLSAYWSQIPRIIEPVLSIAYLLSNTVMYCLLFAIGFFVIIIRWIKTLNKVSSSAITNIWFYMIVGIIWVIVPIFMYSRFINQSGSFYVQKYFFVIMPFVFLITAYAFSELYNGIERICAYSKTKKQVLHLSILLLFCFAGFQNYHRAYSNISAIHEPYREAAEYLSKDKQIYAEDALVICNAGSAWIEYYFNKRGYTIPANVAVYKGKPPTTILFIDHGVYKEPLVIPEEQLLTYKRIYLFEVHETFSEEYIYSIEAQYASSEAIPGFSRVIQEESFIRKMVKTIFHISSETPVIPFGLRIYTR